MDEKEERAYAAGVAQRNRELLAFVLRELPKDERSAESWRLERADVIIQLRSLCGEFGDNDWPDNLHLADVIDKHLADHLRG